MILRSRWFPGGVAALKRDEAEAAFKRQPEWDARMVHRSPSLPPGRMSRPVAHLPDGWALLLNEGPKPTHLVAMVLPCGSIGFLDAVGQ